MQIFSKKSCFILISLFFMSAFGAPAQNVINGFNVGKSDRITGCMVYNFGL